MKAQIIVPAFNESQIIFKVLTSLPKKLKGISDIETILVNDGSQDDTLEQAEKAKVQTVSHVINRGLGAAIKTGIEWAKSKNTDIIITFDSDGQHDSADIPKIIKALITQKADLVIGSRFLKKQKIPLDKLLINKFANLATFLMFGVKSSDSQSGMRAFSKEAIKLIDFKGERMDFSSEILYEAKRNNLRIVEVPIKAIYTPYSRGKGQKHLNAIPILIRFLVRFLR